MAPKQGRSLLAGDRIGRLGAGGRIMTIQSVDEDNGIMQQVESDPDLGRTVQLRIQERVGE